MTWLLSKALMQEFENSHSLQGLAGESSAATCSDGEPYAQWSVMPTPQGFWRNDKMMESSRLSRFGPTLQLLTAGRGEVLLTWFRQDFLARISPSLAEVMELKVSDRGYGKKPRGWFAKYSPDLFSWKTAQCSLVEDWELFSETWPRLGTMQNGYAYLAPTAAHPICEIASGFWPTPLVRDSRTVKGGARQAGSLGTEPLITVMAQAEGKTNGRLSPEWVEWLMGWPLQWTDLNALAMDKYQEWLRQHSIFCSGE